MKRNRELESKRKRENEALEADNVMITGNAKMKLPSRQLGRQGPRIPASRWKEEDHHYIVVPTSVEREWKGIKLGAGLLPLDAQLSNEPGHSIISVGGGLAVKIQYRTGGGNPTEFFKDMEDHVPNCGFVLHLFGKMKNGGFSMGNNVLLTPSSIESIQLGGPWNNLVGIKLYCPECPTAIHQKLSTTFGCPVLPGEVVKEKWRFKKKVEGPEVKEINGKDSLKLHKFYVPSGILINRSFEKVAIFSVFLFYLCQYAILTREFYFLGYTNEEEESQGVSNFFDILDNEADVMVEDEAEDVVVEDDENEEVEERNNTRQNLSGSNESNGKIYQ